MSLTWNLLSHFSSRHTSCCYKLFKQLLKTSIFAALAENLLWPWTWYVTMVRVISQVTRSIWCCNEPRLRSRFDSLSSRHFFHIWVPQWQSNHVERKEEMRSLWWEQHPWNADKPVRGTFKGALGQLVWKKLVVYLYSHLWDDLGSASFVCKKTLSWRHVWKGMSTIWKTTPQCVSSENKNCKASWRLGKYAKVWTDIVDRKILGPKVLTSALSLIRDMSLIKVRALQKL